jgi:putative transposase
VRYLTREWIEEFNQRRPHEELGNLTPEEWKLKVGNNEIMQLTTV